MTTATELLLSSLRIRRPRSGPVALRRINPGDLGGLQAFFDRLTQESVHRRFLSPLRRVPETLIRRMTDVDRDTHFAVAATIAGEAGEQIVAEARFASTEASPRTCEFALTISDDWQGLGMGRRLLRELEGHARAAGMEMMEGECLAQNLPMQELARRCGYRVRRHPEERGLVRLEKRLTGEENAGAPDTGLGPAWARQAR